MTGSEDEHWYDNEPNLTRNLYPMLSPDPNINESESDSTGEKTVSPHSFKDVDLNETSKENLKQNGNKTQSQNDSLNGNHQPEETRSKARNTKESIIVHLEHQRQLHKGDDLEFPKTRVDRDDTKVARTDSYLKTKGGCMTLTTTKEQE